MRARSVPQGDEFLKAVATHLVNVTPPEGPLQFVDSAVLAFLVFTRGFTEIMKSRPLRLAERVKEVIPEFIIEPYVRFQGTTGRARHHVFL